MTFYLNSHFDAGIVYAMEVVFVEVRSYCRVAVHACRVVSIDKGSQSWGQTRRQD